MADENPDLTQEAQALHILLTSPWFQEEMEQANYHSAISFLAELREEAVRVVNVNEEKQETDYAERAFIHLNKEGLQD